MKKKPEKQKDLDALREELVSAANVFLAGYEKITVSQDFELRKTIRGAGANYKVVKNTIAEKAAEGTQSANLLKALKPNVSFVVPPSLQSLLSGSAKDQLAGTLSNSSVGLTWICSFNIPIITICAFLVLNIFLSLFNIVFGWLFFMKICLPFPKIPPKS